MWPPLFIAADVADRRSRHFSPGVARRSVGPRRAMRGKKSVAPGGGHGAIRVPDVAPRQIPRHRGGEREGGW